MYFKTIIIVGSGKIACDCSKILYKAGIQHKVLESNPSQLSMLKNQCKKYDIEILRLNKYQSLEDVVTMNSDGITLVISANNEYIFRDILSLTKITIINFHYGYLPDYRGMNIPSWVIFNNEECTGITWHYINANIDDGNIIAQRRIEIGQFDTALVITKHVMLQGILAFDEFIFDFLEYPIKGNANIPENGMYCYRRKQLPEDGYLNEEKDVENISRILRAFDYGPIEYIPKLRININNKIYQIEKYRIFISNKLKLGNLGWMQDYIIEKDGYRFDLMLREI